MGDFGDVLSFALPVAEIGVGIGTGNPALIVAGAGQLVGSTSNELGGPPELGAALRLGGTAAGLGSGFVDGDAFVPFDPGGLSEFGGVGGGSGGLGFESAFAEPLADAGQVFSQSLPLSLGVDTTIAAPETLGNQFFGQSLPSAFGEAGPLSLGVDTSIAAPETLGSTFAGQSLTEPLVASPSLGVDTSIRGLAPDMTLLPSASGPFQGPVSNRFPFSPMTAANLANATLGAANAFGAQQSPLPPSFLYPPQAVSSNIRADGVPSPTGAPSQFTPTFMPTAPAATRPAGLSPTAEEVPHGAAPGFAAGMARAPFPGYREEDWVEMIRKGLV